MAADMRLPVCLPHRQGAALTAVSWRAGPAAVLRPDDDATLRFVVTVTDKAGRVAVLVSARHEIEAAQADPAAADGEGGGAAQQEQQEAGGAAQPPPQQQQQAGVWRSRLISMQQYEPFWNERLPLLVTYQLELQWSSGALDRPDRFLFGITVDKSTEDEDEEGVLIEMDPAVSDGQCLMRLFRLLAPATWYAV